MLVSVTEIKLEGLVPSRSSEDMSGAGKQQREHARIQVQLR
jgi:hypothetical protein